MKLLIKRHKPKKGNMWQTRPIIPNCPLPIYPFAKLIGHVLAKLQKRIPWVLEDSQNFRNWLSKSSRGIISTYDFTNLYGTEKVKETFLLFEESLHAFQRAGIFKFEDLHDETLFLGLLKPMTLQNSLFEPEHNLQSQPLSALTVFTYMCAKSTIAVLESDENIFNIVKTTQFLAMGSPPVAPLSNITLAYLEFKRFGFDRCLNGMRRLIDDIALDESIISPKELFSAYPDYLTLNEAGNEHFLDVSFQKGTNSYHTWPYVKPFAIIPLNIASAHTQHTKIAAAKGELRRLLNLCSDKEMWPPWIDLWKLRYRIAGYDVDSLSKNVLRDMNVKKEKRIRDHSGTLFHVETWNGCRTDTSTSLRLFSNNHFKDVQYNDSLTAWAQAPTLSNILLGANPKPKQLPYDKKSTGSYAFTSKW